MYDLKTSRLTALVAVVLAALMVGSPATILGDTAVDPVGEAAAADEKRDFLLGVVDMTIQTLNPNTYTMVSEYMVIFPLYSFLIQWDVEAETVIGDLAKSWTVSPDGLTWEFELVETAYFVEYDATSGTLTKGPQVTSEDVKWSIDTLAASTESRLNAYWPDFDGVNIIERTWTDGPFHFGITVNRPFVPLQESLMGNPIFPKYIWEDVDFINYDNIPPVGSGPFYYKTDGLPHQGLARLARNPYWHGEESFGWQLHADEFVMVRYDDDGTLWTALEDGAVDGMLGVPSGTFYNTFREGLTWPSDLEGYHQANGFFYEFNINQMTDENRDYFNSLYPDFYHGSNSQLLLNHSIKKAMSMCLDRNFLIDTRLFGYGSWTTTMVPEQNSMSHSYTMDGHECIPDIGETTAVLDPFDTDAARDLLWDAGWKFDSSGIAYAKDDLTFRSLCPLYNESGDALSFRFATLNTDTDWSTMANDIVGWCEQAGIELTLTLYSVNQMNSIWYAADYDVWLWDWVLTPIAEAISGVIYLVTTDAIPSDSDVYLSDPTIDELYYEALGTMDYEARKAICYDLQDLIYLNRGCIALAFREDLYGFNNNRWQDFGDLNNTYLLLPDISPQWFCMEMSPANNHAPVINSDIGVSWSTSSGNAEVGQPVEFTAYGVSDDNEATGDLNYTWIFGFGGEKVWDTTSSIEYTFDEDGVYTVTLVVKETVPVIADDENGVERTYYDYLSTYKTCEVAVYDMSNTAPHSLEYTWTPLDPTAGEVVTFSASAVDDEGDELYYMWDFGDGTMGAGEVTEHQFPEASQEGYTVTLLVDDRHLGAGARPATLFHLVPVGPNHAPSISVPDYGSITVKVEQTFSVVASDIDPRDDLRYTWDWGDGSTSVTTGTSTTHTYMYKGTYEVEVFADDLTGLDGHNVSDIGMVSVVVAGNYIPVVLEFYADPTSVYLGEAITFTAVASDGDGDPLTFSFDFDDGSEYEKSFPATTPNDMVECTVDHTYTAPGTYSVYVNVTDTEGAKGYSAEVLVSVEENTAPEIVSFDPADYWDTGVAMSLSVSAIDEDLDTLTYTWDFGDGETAVTTFGATTHTFADSDTYTVGVTVDDGKGLSDYAEDDVEVNWVPWIDDPLTVRSVDEDVARDYTVGALDNDTDALTYMWDFGDGTPYVIGPASTVSHTYADTGTYTYTVHVWDAFSLDRATHNVSSSSSVVVGSASTDDPPQITSMGDISAVEGQEISIMVDASDDIDEWDDLIYTWRFGDASPDYDYVGLPPVLYTYDVAGEYTFTIWVCDSGDNNVSMNVLVHIAEDMPPEAVIGGSTTVDEDVEVWFTGEDSEDDLPLTAESFDWTVEDPEGTFTTVSDTMTLAHTWDEPGQYDVTLTVTDSAGQSDEATVTVTVEDATAPVADAGDDLTVHVGTNVTLYGTAVDNVDLDPTLTWEFVYDDGLVERTEDEAWWEFDIMAVYTVTLYAEDDAGNIGEADMVLTVADLVVPVADAGENQIVDEGDTVTFDGSGSYDDDSAITYEWNFTYDGSEIADPLTGVAPTFVFDIAGLYVVTLTVTDEYGNFASDLVWITVNEAVNDPPVADAGADQTVDEGDTVTFDGSGSTDDVTVTNYTWTFTDGTAVTLWEVSPTYVFDTAGTYVVTLTVQDGEGLTDTDTVTITVEEAVVENVAPVADAGDDQTVDEGDTVTFDGSGSTDSDGTIESYEWTFTYEGETETLSGVSPTFEFEAAGTYIVTLTVTDDDGDTDTDTVSITVEEAEEPEPEDKSFLESYGLPIAIIVIILVVLIVAVLLLRKKKSA